MAFWIAVSCIATAVFAFAAALLISNLRLRRLVASPPSAQAPGPPCSDCQTKEGELHALFCTKEPCPFCAGQLSACGCIAQVLDLSQMERKVVDEFIDDSIEPLRGIMARWEAALNLKGRVPYISYPLICAKCGALWPEFFRVPNLEWERYVQLNMREKIICRACFEYIKRVIDISAPGTDRQS